MGGVSARFIRLVILENQAGLTFPVAANPVPWDNAFVGLGEVQFHGEPLSPGTVRIACVSRAGNDMLVQIPSLNGFTYQLETTSSLQPPKWTDSGPTQAGTGSVLTFTDPGAATNGPARFYRVQVQ